MRADRKTAVLKPLYRMIELVSLATARDVSDWLVQQPIRDVPR